MPSQADFSRRQFMAGGLLSGLALSNGRAQVLEKVPYPIIDSHIHFFDSSRPQGVPYGAGRPPALPEVYRFIAEPLGVVGAIEVEASPWVEDNLWVLDISQKATMMVGFVGNLEPEKPPFREYLERYHRHPLFRGIRYGNLWGRNLGEMVSNPEFLSGIKELAAADLVLDTANPTPDLMAAVVRLTDRVPNLRVVLDHLPSMTALDDRSTRTGVEESLRELSKRNAFAKISAVQRRENGRVITDSAAYKPRLDLLWDIFGEDRVVYGSDWPNSAGNWVSFEAALALVRQYFDAKGRAVAEKYFWKNSLAAYKWVKREARQPSAA